MPNDFEAMARKFLTSPEAQKILSDPQKISSIINSPQGKEIAAMLNGDDRIKKAAASGNTGELQNIASALLKTKEGAKLAEELSKNLK